MTQASSGSIKAARKPARKAKRASARASDPLLTILPPEGVPLTLRLASLGERVGAQLADFIATLVAAVLALLLILLLLPGAGSVLMIVFTLIFFFIRVPYYIVTELMWNGRTLAKRWMGLRVISANGRGLTTHQVVIRNLLREIEFFAPLTYLLAGPQNGFIFFGVALVWSLIVLIVPWRSKRNQRIGDIVANTVVISDPKPSLLADLTQQVMVAAKGSEPRFVFSSAQLEFYGRYELQVLERMLRSRSGQHSSAYNPNLSKVVDRILAKISYPEVPNGTEMWTFLEDFYSAQRAHLENRKLFGDARENKHYREDRQQHIDVT